MNLGATATWRGKFTITDAAITTAKKVLCWQAPGPYTSKGTRADEAELQPVSVIAVEPLTGSANVFWQTPPMVSYSFPAIDQGKTATLTDGPLGPGQVTGRRLGKVRGNVRFSYLVMA